MAPHSLLLNLFGAVALLVWATRLVKTGILRAFEDDLRGLLRQAGASRLKSAFAGAGVAAALQSSTGAALILVAFAERGMIPVAAGLAMMLGADVGATAVVQLLSVQISEAIPVFLIIGVLLFMNGTQSRTRQIGRIFIGLALMVLSLGMIRTAAAPMAASQTLIDVLAALAGDPFVAMLVAALVTRMVHSGVAMILLFMAMASSGVLTVDMAIPLILGANIGSGLIPLGLAGGSGVEARRILFGNLGFRILGAAMLVAIIPQLVHQLPATDPARIIADVHSGFNLALAIIFLPLTGLAARLLERTIRPRQPALEPLPGIASHLDETLLVQPPLALGAATREVMRMTDLVEAMLRDALVTFEATPAIKPAQVAAQDNAIDSLQESIKLYLSRLGRSGLDTADERRCTDLIFFTTNLEHIGDIIDKSILPLATKKIRLKLSFSEVGWREIVELHELVLAQLRQSVTVFMTRDLGMARELVAGKDRLRGLERRAMENHLARLRDGSPVSIESSSIHLDVIRDLKRLNAHITAVAYPILEENGALSETRLRRASAQPR